MNDSQHDTSPHSVVDEHPGIVSTKQSHDLWTRFESSDVEDVRMRRWAVLEEALDTVNVLAGSECTPANTLVATLATSQASLQRVRREILAMSHH